MWCLCTFGKTLKTLYFECSLSDDGDFDEMFGEERCKLWEAFVHMLPSCPNLEHLHLFEVNHSSYNVPTTLDSLKKLQLKSFNLTNCDNILNTQDFVELLNKRRLHSLKIVHEEEQVETEYIFDIIEFCENLNDSAAGGLGNLTLESISEWEEMQFLGNILDHLPNTRSLAVKFNWDAFGKMSNDAKRMAQVIKQFISRGMQENFAIVFNLTIDRFEERVKKMRKTKAKKEYHFGKRLLDLVTNMGAEGNVCGQNVDVNDWKAKIVRENVTVNISTVIKRKLEIQCRESGLCGNFNYREEFSLEFALAFMKRVPQITHLKLTPQMGIEQKQLLFHNASKLRVTTFEFSSKHKNCERNRDVVIWCLSTFGQTLETLYFECSVHHLDKPFDAPRCKAKRHHPAGDNDATKYRLERVSKRFNRCLQESWKYSSTSLDFANFHGQVEHVSLQFASAFFKRVPELTHLKLSPHEMSFEQKELLFQNASKLSVTTFEFSSKHKNCEKNSDLILWGLCTFGQKLQTVYFECTIDVDNLPDPLQIGRCKVWETFAHVLPSCPKLQHLHLFQLNQTIYGKKTALDGLKKLKLKSLNLTDCSEALNTQDLVELLNERPIKSLKIVHEEEEIENDDDFYIKEFCEHLNDTAAGELLKLTLEPIIDWKDVKFLASILDHLPNLNNLTVRFNWHSYTWKANDAKNMAQVIEQFLSRGIQENFEIVFNLTIDRVEETRKNSRGKKKYNFGKSFLELVTKMCAETESGQNVDVNNWKAKIIRENVTVNISTIINGPESEKRQGMRE